MLLAGVATAWIAALAFPLATRLGVPPSTAAKLPNAGFFVGMALGLCIGLSRSIKQIVAALLGSVLLGSVLWFFAVLLQSLLIAMGVPDGYVGWISGAAFWCGLLLGLIPVIAISYDKLGVLRARFGRNHT
jgi:hypothetical protein